MTLNDALEATGKAKLPNKNWHIEYNKKETRFVRFNLPYWHEYNINIEDAKSVNWESVE